MFEKLANERSIKVIEDELKKHLTNTYFKEIQVPNIVEAKKLKKERAELVKEIHNLFWQTICERFQYNYYESHKDILIKSKDVNDIIYLASTFYLNDKILQKLMEFKMKNDRLRIVKIDKENEDYKGKFLRYFNDI